MPLTDTHCHLQDLRYGDTLPKVLTKARGVGVTGFVCCGSSEDDWENVLGLASQEKDIVPMLGLHPWYIDKALLGWEKRLENLLKTSYIGLGECGLDFAIPEASENKEEQITILKTQWRMALELNRPLSLHCRKAFEAMFEIAGALGMPNPGAVIHAFSGSAEQAKIAVQYGFYLSFSCSLMNLSNKRARKAILAVPLEKLMLETDSPDISPTKGTLNEPANLAHLFNVVAELLGISREVLEKLLQDNVNKVFGMSENFLF
ncbi:MAG: TatD family hydrolase [Holophagaceae bacterium]|nr:TatD family hydrolase [Holophagaceae bacterium]